MKLAQLVLAVVAPFWLLSCAHFHATAVSRPDGGTVIFNAASASDFFPVADVDVYLFSISRGLALLGTTGENGCLEVRRSVLRRQDAIAVVFCRDGFFCGAFRIKEDQIFLQDDVLILLAPFAIL